MNKWYIISTSNSKEQKYKIIMIMEGATKRKTQNAAKKLVPHLKFDKSDDAAAILTPEEYVAWLGSSS